MQIDRYTTIEKLGEGGMGVVYLAEQSAPVRRQVALKVIRPGMDVEEIVTRFEVERQALAVMDHPNIAKVFDAGATEDGRPYFVMGLGSGTPIHEYCDNNKLTVAQRLELFIAVCNAIQHAHQKGVIHRDLKPSNILVVHQDGVAAPKVIDFGIEKAIGERLSEHTLQTETGLVVGTPAYMSPEQPIALVSISIPARMRCCSMSKANTRRRNLCTATRCELTAASSVMITPSSVMTS